MDLLLEEGALVGVSNSPVDIEAEAAEGQEPEKDQNPFASVPEAMRGPLLARGFTTLTTVQSAVLAEDAEGRDLQISSQTGSGKTVALGFVIGAALRENQPKSVRGPSGPRSLIIVPTRELANQVCDELSWLFAELPATRVASVTGGTPMFRDRQILGQRPRVLVGTPGRLLDHVRSGNLDLSLVAELVLDEADQMLDMGFREDLEAILDAMPAERRTHMVSATFPDGILRLAERYQKDPVAIEGTRLGDANLDIEHVGYCVDKTQRYGALVNLLMQSEGERTLVFVERRADAVEVAERLEADGFPAMPLSGELAQSQRERTLAAFRSGRASVLVATDVAARGLDVPDVGTVIHTAPPINSMVYTHRSGRTGRAGKRGKSVLFTPHYRRRNVERLVREAGVEIHWLPLPNAAQVRAQVAAKARAALSAEIETVLAAGPTPAALAHAEELLEGRDPQQLVAVLLQRLAPAGRIGPAARELPTGPAEPQRQERAPAARPDFRSEPAERAPWKRPGEGLGERPAPRPESRELPYRDAPNGDFIPRPSRPADKQDGVRFFINWGFNQGATPGRLLAAICRRGQVQGTEVGSIAIHPNASTFGIHPSVAERFEDLAGRRDQRDPQLVIRRDRANY